MTAVPELREVGGAKGRCLHQDPGHGPLHDHGKVTAVPELREVGGVIQGPGPDLSTHKILVRKNRMNLPADGICNLRGKADTI